MENGFQGKTGQTVPEMTDEFVDSVSERYIELYEIVTGEPFKRTVSEDVISRIEFNINNFLSNSLWVHSEKYVFIDFQLIYP